VYKDTDQDNFSEAELKDLLNKNNGTALDELARRPRSESWETETQPQKVLKLNGGKTKTLKEQSNHIDKKLAKLLKLKLKIDSKK